MCNDKHSQEDHPWSPTIELLVLCNGSQRDRRYKTHNGIIPSYSGPR